MRITEESTSRVRIRNKQELHKDNTKIVKEKNGHKSEIHKSYHYNYYVD